MPTGIGTAIVLGGLSTASAAMGFTAIIGGSLMTHFLVTTALGAVLNALTPKPNLTAASGYAVTATGSILDHQVVYGKTKVYGARVFDATTGDSNKYLHRVIALTGHEIESYEQVWINDSYINFADIDIDGNIPSVVDPDGSTSDRYNNKMRIKFHYGTDDQLADADLVSESDGLWTTDHRLRGIAYIYIRMEFNQDVYPNGIPEIGVVIKGKKLYDPRTGLTEWSDNAALCLRDYLSNPDYGLGENDENIDDDLVSVAANVCEYSNYPTLTGTARYTANGAFTTGITPYDLLQSLLSSMGGLLWYAQGKWRMKPAYWTPAVHSFNEDDLRSGISINTRHSRRDNFNTVNGTWRSEDTNWQETDFAPVSNAAFVEVDNGQEKSIDLKLPFTSDFDMARRIANIYLERNRQQLTVNASFGMRAFQVQVGDVIELNNTRFGWVDKEFEVVAWTFGLVGDNDLQVQMTLREITSTVFDDYSDGIVYERDNTSLASAFDVQTPTLEAPVVSSSVNEDGTSIPQIKFSWFVVEEVTVDHYEFQWKLSTETTWDSVILAGTEFTVSPALTDSSYDYRVRAINHFGVRSAFTSSTSPVQTQGDTIAPNAPTAITATGGFKYITIEWDNPADADFSHVEIWENTSNILAGASQVSSSFGSSFVRTNLGVDQTRWYFLRSVDNTGNKSAFTSGVSGTTTYLDDPDFEGGIYTLFQDQGLYAIRDVTSLPASGAFVGEKVFNRTDAKLYQWDGSSWVLVVAEPDTFIAYDKIIANTITGGLLATSGIITNSAQIDDALITNAKIDDAAISTAKIQDLSVDTLKIAENAVTRSVVWSGLFASGGGAGFTINRYVTIPNCISGSQLSTAMIFTARATVAGDGFHFRKYVNGVATSYFDFTLPSTNPQLLNLWGVVDAADGDNDVGFQIENKAGNTGNITYFFYAQEATEFRR